MLYFILIAAASLLYDPGLYDIYNTPKMLFAFVFIPVICIYNTVKHYKSGKAAAIGIMEAVILLRLIWIILNNHNAGNINSLLFLVLLSLLTLSLKAAEAKDIQNLASKIFIVFISLGLIEAIIGLFQLKNYIPNGDFELKTPIIGTIGSPNGTGLILSLGMMASVIEIYKSRFKSRRLILLVPFCLMAAVILLNGSRGGIMAFCNALFFVILKLFNDKYRNVKINKSRKLAYVTAAVTLVILINFLLFSLNKESSNGRLMIWKISWPMFKENMFVGLGYDKYAGEYLNYQKKYFENHNKDIAYKAANIKQAHNEIIQAFCETGLIGGVIYILMWIIPLLSLFKKMWRNAELCNNKKQIYETDDSITIIGMWSLLFIVFCHSMVDSVMHIVPIEVIAYFLLGLNAVYIRQKELQIPKASAILKNSNLMIYSLSATVLMLYLAILNHSSKQYEGYALWQKGYSCTFEQKWDNAAEYYLSALRFIPDQGELKYHLGSAYVNMKEYVKGIEYLEKSAVSFNDKNIWMMLSYANMKKANYSKAEKYAFKCLGMFPEHIMPYYLLGEINYYSKNYEKSKEYLKKCINSHPNIMSQEVIDVTEEAAYFYYKYYD